MPPPDSWKYLFTVNLSTVGGFFLFSSPFNKIPTRNTTTNLMKIARLLLLFAVTLFSATAALAQKPNKYLVEANKLFNTGMYATAAEKYQAAEPRLTSVEDKGFAFYRTAECYRLSYKSSTAEQWYEKAITAQYYKQDPDVHYNYGRVLQDQGKWELAQAQFNKYLERGGEKGKGNEALTACKTAADKAAILKPDVVVQPATEFNTPFMDYAPTWADKDEESIIFSSGRKEAVGNDSEPIFGSDESFTDLFVSSADKKGKWSTPVGLNTTVNTTGNEGVATFAEKFKLMYFTRCEVDGNGRFGCDIFTSKRSGDNYEAAQRLVIIDREAEEADDSTRIGHPALTDDGKYLIFASNMAGGKGGRDLWYMAYDKKSDTWGKPQNLSSVNTAADEMFPYITKRGEKEILFFSSTRAGGLGGLDIYQAEKTGDFTFGDAKALAFPINSSADDFGIIFYPENKKKYAGYFSSNRTGGRGGDDIYSFDEPPVEICFKGTVYDKKTGTPLSGVAVTTVISPEGKNIPLTTDGNGGFSLCNKELKNKDILTVDFKKEGYISPPQDKVNIGEGKSRTINREYFMERIIINTVYRMPMVYYPFDQTQLLIVPDTNSADSLNFLLDLMNTNPNFVVQLESHTDARGSDVYNQKLSQGRAQTCVDYLISKGINPARLVAAGRGEKDPSTLDRALGNLTKGTLLTEANINTLPENLREQGHNLNRRTVFRILRTDFVPKN